jgi:inhibitor of KinA sporulation pathway (predicted exonuclease)
MPNARKILGQQERYLQILNRVEHGKEYEEMTNYVIFDLEASCGKEIPNGESEIIEIGAVKLNEKLEIVDEFQSFIRPIIHPTITYFCEELTSITQSDVDGADTFDIVFPKFYEWATDIRTSKDWFTEKPTWFCSWGFYDKKMILSDLKKHKHMYEAFADVFASHISIKHQHGQMIGNKRGVGMATALNMLGLTLDGTHHRAISDARNIAKIFIEIFPKLKFERSN